MHKLLLLEGDAFQAASFEQALAMENVKIFSTDRIEQAAGWLRDVSFDIIVLDSGIVNSNSTSYMTEIKKITSEPGRYILYSILEKEINDFALSPEIGPDDFIVKPFRREEVLLRLGARLKRLNHVSSLNMQLEQLNILLEIGTLPHTTMRLEELLDRILSIVQMAFQCSSCAIYMRTKESGSVSLSLYKGNIDRDDLTLLSEFCAEYTFQDGSMQVIPDTTKLDELSEISWNNPGAFINIISVPLVANDVKIGVQELYNVPEIYLKDKKILDNIKKSAIEAAKVLNITHQFNEVHNSLQGAIEELSVIYEVSDALSSTLNLDEMLQLIVRNAMKSFKATVVSLMMLDASKEHLYIRFAEGLDENIIEHTQVKIGEGIAGKVVQTGDPLLLVDSEGIKAVDVEENIKSALSVPLRIKNEVIGVLNVSKTSRYRFKEKDLKLLINLASLAAQAIEKAALYQDIKDSLEEIKSSYLSTVKALSRAIEAKDPYTQGHVDRVAKYGLAVALELNPDLLKDDTFRYALVLHDVGKIEIPDAILTKPGKLTKEEMDIMRRHPETGAQIISPVKFLKEAADMVRYHQERYDGKGYPLGLKGDEIPLVARIISVADAFDAIISDRPYRKARSIEFARQEILRNSGTQFDPKVVESFMTCLEKRVIP